MPLLIRSSRRLTRPPAGQQVFDTAKALLSKLQALEGRLAPSDLPFRLRVHVSLAVRWLLPRLTDFYALHSDLALTIETVATEQVDPAGDCHACILYLPQAPTDPTRSVLFEDVLVAVCAPRSVDGKPAPASIDALEHYPLIHGSAGHLEWAQWFKAHARAAPKHAKHLTFNLDELALDAAHAGWGLP